MSTATPRAARRWAAAVDEHQAALAAYLEIAARLSDEAWTKPWAPGKWSPATITEHLAMAYRVSVQEARGGPGMRLKLTPMYRRVLRTFLLPHMLFHRTFPRGARAPREVRPETDGPPREQALAELRVLGEEFEAEVARARAGGRQHLTHPYFGEIDMRRGMRFAAVHIEHHTRQLAKLL
jgi:hypothetical protein